MSKQITLVGAGLVGSLLSIFFRRAGYAVHLIERRGDMRTQSVGAGRSINLAISTRGLHALAQVGLEERVLKHCIPMTGRQVHLTDGSSNFQAYGRDETECIRSLSRGKLNEILLGAAESEGVSLEFNKRVVGMDLFRNLLICEDERNAKISEMHFETVLGTDGSASAIRGELMKLPLRDYSQQHLKHGYKELVLPAGPNGAYQLKANALHIWPRGEFMLIALPNEGGSFTCTLFLKYQASDQSPGFDQLQSALDVKGFFQEYFKDVLNLIPDLAEQFLENPTGHMCTVKSGPWHFQDKALLVGDAAHAIVPFFGQGMNCGFEDCEALGELLSNKKALEKCFEEFFVARKINTDAIADMAVENFVEMSSKVADPVFLLKKEIEKRLQKEFPDQFLSRYSAVSFSRMPYSEALDLGRRNEDLLQRLAAGVKSASELDSKTLRKILGQVLGH